MLLPSRPHVVLRSDYQKLPLLSRSGKHLPVLTHSVQRCCESYMITAVVAIVAVQY